MGGDLPHQGDDGQMLGADPLTLAAADAVSRPAVANKKYLCHPQSLPILGDLHKENKRLSFDLHKFSSYNLVYYTP